MIFLKNYIFLFKKAVVLIFFFLTSETNGIHLKKSGTLICCTCQDFRWVPIMFKASFLAFSMALSFTFQWFGSKSGHSDTH